MKKLFKRVVKLNNCNSTTKKGRHTQFWCPIYLFTIEPEKKWIKAQFPRKEISFMVDIDNNGKGEKIMKGCSIISIE